MRYLIVLVALGVACGPETGHEELSQDFFGRWASTIQMQTGDCSPAMFPANIGVSLVGTTAYLDRICPAGARTATATGQTGGIIEWSGDIQCDPTPIGGCDDMAVRVEHVVLALMDRGRVHAAMNGVLLGCGRNTSFMISGTLLKQ